MWISLLTAGKNGGECSMEGDGLRAEGERMDEREQTSSARVIHPTQADVCNEVCAAVETSW